MWRGDASGLSDATGSLEVVANSFTACTRAEDVAAVVLKPYQPPSLLSVYRSATVAAEFCCAVLAASCSKMRHCWGQRNRKDLAHGPIR